jgi:hypothetical protein
MLTQTPWIFGGDAAGFASWRADIAHDTACKPEDVYVVGSSVFGYSLSPTKAGRAFRHGSAREPPSDIDIVIVSEMLFEESWHVLRRAEILNLIAPTRGERDKIRTDIYWGYVANVTVPPNTGVARAFRRAMAKTTSRVPFRGHPAKARVYRHYDDVLSYHTHSLRDLRRELQ